MKNLFVLFFGLFSVTSYAQPGWTWTELPNMPEGVANNAVTHGYSGDSLCVYTFTGIDSTLVPSGIHLKSWRYNTVSQEWMQLPNVPDFQGKIAAGASTVGNLIYVVGGYYVNDNFTEESSDDIHIFDPETNQWLDDGMNIPIAIDDQVQAVYKDSLIFVVTGWSNTTNVTAVQIYDPAFDSWQEGTPLANVNTWKAFGASGEFVGDSLFFFGGVSSGSFNALDSFRRGILDENDPTMIEWELLDDFPWDAGYRAAAAQYQDRLFWIGGSSVSYNFNAMAYNGSGVVQPEHRIATYYSGGAIWEEGLGAPYGVMDLRGIAKVSETSWIICGGILADQEVSDRAFLLELDPDVGIDEESGSDFNWSFSQNTLTWSGSTGGIVQVRNLQGKLIRSFSSDQGQELLNLSAGTYILTHYFQSGLRSHKFVVVN